MDIEVLRSMSGEELGQVFAKLTNAQMLEVVQRFIQTSDIGTGLLNPEQRAEFIDSLQDHTVMLKDARQFTLNGASQNIDTIGMAEGQLRLTTEGIAPEDAIAITTGQNVLTARETMMWVEVTYATFRKNIMRDGLESTLINLITKQYMNDLEAVALTGDVLSADPFIKINDGYIKLAKAIGNTYNTHGTSDWVAHFGALLDQMDDDWDEHPDLKFYVNVKDARQYRRQLSERGDGLLYLIQKSQPDYEGIPVQPVRKMPRGTVMLTPSSNLAYGIDEAIEVERDKDIGRRVYQYALTTSTDFEFVIDDAVVIGYNQD